MHAARNPVPEWLEDCHSVEHIDRVLDILADREKTRESARRASRHKSHPSKVHRMLYTPATMLSDAEIVEHYSIGIGCHPHNAPCNRYTNVEPYDRTRVLIADNREIEEAERYLNASWVRELAGGKWYIATQAPLPDTVHAFLSVLLQPISRPPPDLHPHSESDPGPKTSRIRTIVQLTRNVESGQRKAHVYFPPMEGESWVVSPEPGYSAASLKVSLHRVEQFDDAHCTLSTVSIQSLSEDGVEDVDEPVVFKHMLFSSWPDHGVPEPEHRSSLLRFLQLVDAMNRDISEQPPAAQGHLDPDPPIMVGCSAGIGRTGSFIALSSLLRANGFLPPSTSSFLETSENPPNLQPSPLGPLPEELQHDLVAQEIDSLREQRPGMVQRQDQVILVYEALIEAFFDSAQDDPQPYSEKET